MTRRHSLRIAALAAAVSLDALVAASGHAQSVRIFEDAPSLEQLRSILIPETKPGGLSRRIEIPRRESIAGEAPIRQAAAEQAPPSQTVPPPSAPLRPTPERRTSPEITASPSEGDAPIQAMEPAPAAPKQLAVAARSTPRADTSPPTADAVGFRINFALNSAIVPAASQTHLDRIGELMRQEPGLKLVVEGHTDALGSDDYNLELSERRAVSVARYLVVRHGIEPDRLHVSGKGKAEPLLENPYDPRNRRVQFLRQE